MLSFVEPRWLIMPRAWQGAAFEEIVDHFSQSSPARAVIQAIMGAGKALLIAETAASCRITGNECIVISTSTQHLVEDLYELLCRRMPSDLVGVWYGGRPKRLGRVIVTCVPSVANLAGALRARGRRVALWIADEAHRSEAPSLLAAHEVLAPAHSLGFTATPFRSSQWESLSLFDCMLYTYGVAEAQASGVVVPWRIIHAEVGGDLDEVVIEMLGEAEGPGLVNAIDIQDAEDFAALLSSEGVSSEAIHSRQSLRRNRRVLQDLSEGALRAVVHVNTLAEGANFPWLRWLALRRQVQSRVRFVQEIGRLLRSHPGKSEAVFYDPHDLFGSFHLSYGEALGEPPEKPEWEMPFTPENAGERIRDSDPAIALAWIESVLRSLVVACDAAGMLRTRKIIAKHDRTSPSFPIQHRMLTNLIGEVDELAPTGWRKCLRAMAEKPELIRFGWCADAIVALDSVRAAGKWPRMGPDVELEGSVGQLAFKGVL